MGKESKRWISAANFFCLLSLLPWMEGCAINGGIEYPEDGHFDECRAACEKELPSIQLPFCTLFSSAEFGRFKWLSEQLDLAVEQSGLPYEACGCITTRLAENGRLEDLQVHYSNSEAAVAIISRQVSEFRPGEDLFGCLAGIRMPFIFPGRLRYFIDEIPESQSFSPHTTYEMREFIADRKLKKLSEVQLSDPFGWRPLNIAFGILYLNERRFLTELRLCTAHFQEDFTVDEISNSNVLRAGQNSINECPIVAFYSIQTEEQELALIKIASATFQNP